MQQGLLFAPVTEGTQRVPDGITMFVSVRVHKGKLAISSPLMAHTAPIYADAAGAVAQLLMSGEVHVNADQAVLAALIELWRGGGPDGE